MQDIQNSLFDTMKFFTEHSIKNSDSMTSVKCEVKEDLGGNNYKVDYYGSLINAKASGGMSYSIGDMVYVLLQENDLSKDKFILNLASPSARTYVSDIDSIKIYRDVSDNLINLNDREQSIQSYTMNDDDDEYIIRETIKIDIDNLAKEYLKDYKKLSFGFKVMTKLEEDRQFNGNYGMKLIIPFIDTSSSNSEINKIEKVYFLDVGNMLGKPYNFKDWAKQNIYIDIDKNYEFDTSDKNKKITIQLFSYNFLPVIDDKGLENEDSEIDIFFKDINLKFVDMLSSENLNGYNLSLNITQGKYFSDNNKDSKIITPVLRVNGKQTSFSDNTEFYWFKEDLSVKNQNSEGYHKTGGIGWRCINDKEKILNNDNKVEYQYKTNLDTYTLKKEDVYKSLRIKCVVIYDEKDEISVIEEFKNLNDETIIEISSSNPNNIFLNSSGNAEIIIKTIFKNINEENKSENNLKYEWIRYDKENKYINDNGNFYAIKKLNEKIIDGDKTIFETIISIPVHMIDTLNRFSCAIYNNDNLISTESITLRTVENYDYILTLENADIVYKYDADGDSPTSSRYDGSSNLTHIKPIIVTLRKNDGTEFSKSEYDQTKFTWEISSNALLKLSDNAVKVENYGDVGRQLTYSLKDTYNASSAKELLTLTVDVKGSKITRVVPISFIKEGENGSNGTKYSAQILYDGYAYGQRTSTGLEKKLKFLILEKPNKTNEIYYSCYKNDEIYYASYNTNKIYNSPYENDEINSEEARILTLNVYENGSPYPVDSKNIKWSIFDNYFSKHKIEINNNGQISFNNAGENDVSIVQAEIHIQKENEAETIVYCYYPIEITTIKGVNQFNIAPNIIGGFGEVMYDSQGANPSWDTTVPFSFVDDRNIMFEGFSDYIKTEWELGDSVNWKTLKDTAASTIKPIPNSLYNNGKANNYVKVTVQKDGGKVEGKIKELEDEIKNLNNEIDDNNKKLLTFINEDINKIYYYSNIYKPIKDNIKSSKENIGKKVETLAILTDIQNLGNSLYSMVNSKVINNFNLDVKKYLQNCQNFLKENIDLEELTIEIIDKETTNLNFNTGEASYNINITYNKEKEKNKVPVNMTNNFLRTYKRLGEKIQDYKNIFGDANLKYPETVKEIKDQIAGFIGRLHTITVKGNKNLEFKKLLEDMCAKEENYINKIYQCNNYNEMMSLLNNFYKEVFSTLYDKPKEKEKSLVLKENIENEYFIEYQKQLNEEKNKKTKEIETLENFINTNDNKIIHIRPIVFYYNRYGFEHLNAWDGNKIKTQDGYLLAPQVGAGKKDSKNNFFTGLLMGQKNINEETTAVGLFGYNDGVQTIFLDASNGSAIFGTGGNRIEITPTKSTIHFKDVENGVIYSGQHEEIDNAVSGFHLSAQGLSIGSKVKITSDGIAYFGTDALKNNGDNKWTINGKEKTSYIGYNGESLEMDYKEGKIKENAKENSVYIGTDGIRLGKNFAVNNKGECIAKSINVNLANIGGWTIEGNNLIGRSGNNKIVLDPTNGIYHQLYKDKKWNNGNFKINIDGSASFDNISITGGSLKIGKNKDKAIINPDGSASFTNVQISGGTLNINNNATIDKDGNAKFNNITATGTINANNGYIGNSSNSVTSGGIAFQEGTISLGTPGYSEGKVTSGIRYDAAGNVSIGGNIYAQNGYFSGTIKSTNGDIGGWIIREDRLYIKGEETPYAAYINNEGKGKFTNLVVDYGGLDTKLPYNLTIVDKTQTGSTREQSLVEFIQRIAGVKTTG